MPTTSTLVLALHLVYVHLYNTRFLYFHGTYCMLIFSSLYSSCVVCLFIYSVISTPFPPPPSRSFPGEDKVTFSFNRTKLSNNGTDPGAGQLPALLYCLGTEKDIAVTGKAKETTEVPEDYLVAISKKFSLKVTQVSEWIVDTGVCAGWM